MRDAFIEALTSLAEADEDVMLLTADLGFGVLTDFADRFPRQFVNVGVAEQNMTGVAAGLALTGKRVFTYSIANFPTLRCLEQIRNDVCYHDLPVTIVAIGGGLSYGPLGFSHHATEDLAVMRALPGMTVVAPGDDEEAADATRALHELRRPAYLRLDRQAPRRPGLVLAPFELGQMSVVRDTGEEVVLVSTGAILRVVMEAADELAARGVGVTVLSCHTVKPFDAETLGRFLGRGADLVVTVEEHSRLGGLGSAAAEVASDPATSRRVPVLRVGLPDVLPTMVGSQEFLRNEFGLTPAAIADAAQQALGEMRRNH